VCDTLTHRLASVMPLVPINFHKFVDEMYYCYEQALDLAQCFFQVSFLWLLKNATCEQLALTAVLLMLKFALRHSCNLVAR